VLPERDDEPPRQPLAVGEASVEHGQRGSARLVHAGPVQVFDGGQAAGRNLTQVEPGRGRQRADPPQEVTEFTRQQVPLYLCRRRAALPRATVDAAAPMAAVSSHAPIAALAWPLSPTAARPPACMTRR